MLWYKKEGQVSMMEKFVYGMKETQWRCWAYDIGSMEFDKEVAGYKRVSINMVHFYSIEWRAKGSSCTVDVEEWDGHGGVWGY